MILNRFWNFVIESIETKALLNFINLFCPQKALTMRMNNTFRYEEFFCLEVKENYLKSFRSSGQTFVKFRKFRAEIFFKNVNSAGN